MGSHLRPRLPTLRLPRCCGTRPRHPRFIFDFWKDTMRYHGILPHFITVYHPQTDGPSEAFLKKMKEVVKLVSSKDEWARDLPRIQACINHTCHSLLQLFVFYVLETYYLVL